MSLQKTQWSRHPQPPTDQPPILALDPLTLRQWMEQESILLIDVREAGEFAGERIAGAIHQPLSTFDPMDPIGIPRPGQKRVLYCQTGNRSYQAAQTLIRAGVTPVLHLAGGLNAWKEAGYSVEPRLMPPSV